MASLIVCCQAIVLYREIVLGLDQEVVVDALVAVVMDDSGHVHAQGGLRGGRGWAGGSDA